jgi:DNA-binding transcriptional MerR regulator
MNTKEVCRQLSVTPKMLRVYENQKLIQAGRDDNNYRNYSIEDMLQIQIIVMLRNLGFSIKEIKIALSLKITKNDLLNKFYIQLKAVETKVNELTLIKDNLNNTINRVLTEEVIDEEFFHTIYSSYKNDFETTTYENMINRWNFDEMAVDYINRYLKGDTGYLNSINRTADILLDMFKNKRILDVGGGTCNLWVDFPENTQLTVMDQSLQMIFAAMDKVPWASYILDDILKIEKNKYEQFDIVVSTFTLHHIPYEQHEKAMSSIIDLCNNHGCVIIVDRSFKDNFEKENYERELIKDGNLEQLDIIRSEFYIIADHLTNYVHYLGYSVETLFFEKQIWGFLINKN